MQILWALSIVGLMLCITTLGPIQDGVIYGYYSLSYKLSDIIKPGFLFF